MAGPDSENNNQSQDGVDESAVKSKYPIAVFFIFVTEFCERFSYAGMRAVLTLYLRNVLGFSENLSTTIYHVFLLLCYALPVFGGILADNYLGKYRTILYISIVYAIGNITLSSSSVSLFHLPTVPLTILGLLLIAVGTGGIKPCVVALGGEQFNLPAQAKLLGQFFAIFTFIVNVGSLLSTTVTPIFRRDVHCFGEDTCYPLAFSVPGSLMFVGILVFISGKRLYRMIPPEGNIMVKVVKCISYAINMKLKAKARGNSGEKATHWLDYSKNKYENKLISDTKSLVRILIYYLPIPMFWALYEQLGSRWTFQATRLDGVIGRITIKPDQMQVANSILMMCLIPIAQMFIYPLFHKCGLLKRPLQRMGVGGIFAAVSFVLAGFLELQIQSTSFSNVPSSVETSLNFVNTLSCPVRLHRTYNDRDSHQLNANDLVIAPEHNSIIPSILTTTTLSFAVGIQNAPYSDPDSSCNSMNKLFPDVSTRKLNYSAFVIGETKGRFETSIISVKNGSISLTRLSSPDDLGKSKEGYAKIRFVFNSWSRRTNASKTLNNLLRKIQLSSTSTSCTMKSYPLLSIPNNEDSGVEVSGTFEVEPDTYNIILEDQKNMKTLQNSSIELRNGGSYLLVITDDELPHLQSLEQDDLLKIQLIILTPPNEVHMLWILPQYVVMACAEILFIISGMEFSFTEAPESMKSVLQSCWHLTNAVGNSIVIIFAQFVTNEATGFFTFAVLMAVDVIFFALLTSRYKYVTPDKGKEESKDVDETNL